MKKETHVSHLFYMISDQYIIDIIFNILYSNVNAHFFFINTSYIAFNQDS